MATEPTTAFAQRGLPGVTTFCGSCAENFDIAAAAEQVAARRSFRVTRPMIGRAAS